VEKYCRAWQATDDNIMWHMHIACWIPNDTDTHSECVILITFTHQQWLHERTSLLRYSYIACVVEYILLRTTVGTALQIGRSLVRFQMVSFEFFIDIILPIALWPWG
jgi:hypothetical protein